MNTFHMIPKVPAAGKSLSWFSSVTITEMARVRIVAMSMHAVGLSLVAEQAGIGREFKTGTFFVLATVRPQVGVQVFAVVREISHEQRGQIF